MNRDMNDTLVFVRVVQAGSFTAAAHALQMPKTTVSRRVMALERFIGAQLLRRSTRRLSLTEAGAVYFEKCKQVAETLEAAESAVQQLRDGPRGWLRVTLPYSFGVSWFAPLIAGFRARYSDIRLELLASHETLDLIKEELDVALRLGALPDSSLVARRLGGFPTGIYASPAYLDQHGCPQSPDDLGDHKVLSLHQGQQDVGHVWPLRQGSGRLRGYLVNPVVVASDPALLRDAVLAGEGLTLAMDASMAADVAEGRLVRVLAQWQGPVQEFHAVTPRERLPSPKLKAFIDYLREAIRQ